MCKLNKNVLLILALFVMMIALGTPTAVQAQDVAAGSATATVQTPLTVTASAALVFGTIFQGVATSIAEGNANAGVFTIDGQAAAGISLYLQLPDYMSTATGDDRMVISFSTTDCAIDSTGASDPTTFVGGFLNQNPYNLPTTVVIGTAAGTDLYLGGSVNPSVDQTAGAYTADIILTVAYNGS